MEVSVIYSHDSCVGYYNTESRLRTPKYLTVDSYLPSMASVGNGSVAYTIVDCQITGSERSKCQAVNTLANYLKTFCGGDAQVCKQRALLEAGSDEEDFFLSGPNVSTGKLKDPKMSRLQNQVDDVVGIMKNNVGKVLERGERLEDLQDKSDSLASNSDVFRSRSRDLRRNMWWKNCKMKILLVLIILIVLAIIIIPIIVKSRGN